MSYMLIAFSFNIILFFILQCCITIFLKVPFFTTIIAFNVFLLLLSFTLLFLVWHLPHCLFLREPTILALCNHFLCFIRLHICHYRPISHLVHCFISTVCIPRGKQLIIHSHFFVSVIETICAFRLLHISVCEFACRLML